MRTFFLMLFTLLSLIGEANQKTVNEIYLNTWANAIDIDSNQFFDLENIACQNPLIGGHAVYGARIMLGLDYECSNGANRSAQINEEFTVEVERNNNFGIYPNPSSGIFTLKNNSDELVNGRIQILEITGKVITEFKLNTPNITVIDISHLPAGLYHYIIFSSEVMVYSDKLVISK